MKHIDTTLTTLNLIKILAKKMKKENGTQLCKAHEEISKALGYDNFNHVHHCIKNTKPEN